MLPTWLMMGVNVPSLFSVPSLVAPKMVLAGFRCNSGQTRVAERGADPEGTVEMRIKLGLCVCVSLFQSQKINNSWHTLR